MTTADDHMQALQRFEGTAILCVGDLMLDRYVHGRVTRISPEAPIPVLRVDRETAMPGAVGNVIANIHALGGVPHVGAVVGNDEAGRQLQALLGDFGSAASVLIADPTRPTTVKTRFVSGSQQLLRADNEVTRPVSDGTERALIQRLDGLIGSSRAVVISDYRKGSVTRAIAQAVIAAAARAGIPVVVDAKPDSFAFFAGAAVLKPNKRELADATSLPVETDDQLEAAARKLIQISGVACIVATRSEQGISIVHAEGDAIHLRTEAREVYDVSGAGDTVAATLAMALGTGCSVLEATILANHAAGIVVGKVGTAMVRLAELRDAVDANSIKSAHKVKSLDDAADEAERWRTRGVRVGFTNGCFDLLHPGHVSILAQARGACDRLIVGLNSDASVKRLKGETRPVNDEHARAAVLAALEDVDTVVVFGEDTPRDIIERLRPDVLVKGADYALEQVVGAEFVMSYGGKVVLADLKAGHSTTSMIGRMKQ